MLLRDFPQPKSPDRDTQAFPGGYRPRGASFLADTPETSPGMPASPQGWWGPGASRHD